MTGHSEEESTPLNVGNTGRRQKNVTFETKRRNARLVKRCSFGTSAAAGQVHPRRLAVEQAGLHSSARSAARPFTHFTHTAASLRRAHRTAGDWEGSDGPPEHRHNAALYAPAGARNVTGFPDDAIAAYMFTGTINGGTDGSLARPQQSQAWVRGPNCSESNVSTGTCRLAVDLNAHDEGHLKRPFNLGKQ